MMPLHRSLVILAAATIAAGMVSCAPKSTYSGEPETGSEAESGPRVVKATQPIVSPKSESDDDLRVERGNILNERLVFFDYDKSVVKLEFRSILDGHTDFLVDNRNVRVILQGHADERGSTEYNLALGQRRSDAVREYLVAGGVFAEQIEAVSYGEERPRALGSNEAAWAENRRVEIVYGDE